MEPGQCIHDRYRLEKRLATEDWLAIYRALDERTGERVTLHVYAACASWQDNPRLDPRPRARDLVALLADLSHPHLLCPRDHLALADGSVVLVYPWVNGQPLDERLASGPLPPDKALRMAIDLCNALQALHTRGVVHRDVKPRNVILAANGAVLGGVDWAQTPGDLLSSGPPKRHPGSPAYMSPEQADTSGPLDARSDLYSVGLVLAEALGDTVGQSVAPAAAANRRFKEYGPLGRVLSRALQREPSQRYQTARELQNDLEALAEGSVIGRLGLLARQLPGAVWALGGLVVVALVWALLGSGPLGADGTASIARDGPETSAPIAWVVDAAAEAPQGDLPSGDAAMNREPPIALEVASEETSAAELRVGQFIERAFRAEDEVHRAAIRVAGGRGYMIATANLAAGVDTYLDVSYDGWHISNDDAWPGTLASRVFVMPAQDTTLWVQVTNRGVTGDNATYELLVVEAEPTPTQSPTATLTPDAGMTMTPRPTYTPRSTATSTLGATRTPRPTSTRRPTYTPRPTMSLTPSTTPTPSPTWRPTATATPPRTVLPIKTATTPVW